MLLAIGTQLAVGCGTTRNSTVSATVEQRETVRQFELIVKFSSDEGLKRAMFGFEKFRMTILEDISTEDAIYRILIQCKEYEIDGVIRKLNDDANIEWAKRSE